MFDRKRSRTVAVSLTVAEGTLIVAEGTLGSLIGGAKSSGHGHRFKKIKHQTAQGCGEHGSVTRLAQFWDCLKQHNLMSIGASHNDRWTLKGNF
jgi:hypothetical protein